MPQQEVETYQGLEREQEFVRKFDDRLFTFCVARHKQRWEGKKAIPSGVRHKGEEGWWFPKSWSMDFADRFGAELRTKRKPPDFEQRARQIEAASAKLGKNTFSLRELESWALPEGTQFQADATVVYPDGTWEAFDAIRARVGPYRATHRHAEQENLEALLKMTKRHLVEEGEISSALANSPLTKADWGQAA